jgi:hypothetical protein
MGLCYLSAPPNQKGSIETAALRDSVKVTFVGNSPGRPVLRPGPAIGYIRQMTLHLPSLAPGKETYRQVWAS